MKDETLELIRKEANYKKGETKLFNDKVRRILELEKDPKVMEYSLLLKSIVGIPRIIDLSEDDIYELAYRQHANDINEDDTIGIFVYMGAFYPDPRYGGYEMGVPEDSPNAVLKKYWDIELGTVTRVNIDDSEQFEKEHYVIFANGLNEMGVYRTVQREFLREAIDNGQEAALKLIHKKYDREENK